MKFWVPFSIMLMIVTGVVKFLLPFLILGLVLVAAYVLYATGQKLGWDWQQILQTNARTVVAAVIAGLLAFITIGLFAQWFVYPRNFPWMFWCYWAFWGWLIIGFCVYCLWFPRVEITREHPEGLGVHGLRTVCNIIGRAVRITSTDNTPSKFWGALSFMLLIAVGLHGWPDSKWLDYQAAGHAVLSPVGYFEYQREQHPEISEQATGYWKSAKNFGLQLAIGAAGMQERAKQAAKSQAEGSAEPWKPLPTRYHRSWIPIQLFVGSLVLFLIALPFNGRDEVQAFFAGFWRRPDATGDTASSEEGKAGGEGKAARPRRPAEESGLSAKEHLLWAVAGEQLNDVLKSAFPFFRKAAGKSV